MEKNQISDTIDIEKSELYMSNIHNILQDEKKFEQYKKRYKNRLYTLILLTLTHKSFDEKEAKEIFEGILAHKKELEQQLKRDIGLTVVTLDYLQNIKKLFRNPTIIEESTSDFLADSTTKDGLTHLYERDILDVFLQKEIEKAKRTKTHVSFMMIDIDDFKKVNDNYGHQKGDEVLETIGDVINENIREMDFAARYGGEELCVVMPNTTSKEALKLAQRIRQEIASLFFDDFSVTVSIGLSQSNSHIKNEKELISLADKALYKAKENGKDQVIVNEKS